MMMMMTIIIIIIIIITTTTSSSSTTLLGGLWLSHLIDISPYYSNNKKSTNRKGVKNNTNFGQITGIKEKPDTTCK